MKQRIIIIFLMLSTLLLMNGCGRKSTNIAQGSSSDKVLQKDSGSAVADNSKNKSKDTIEVVSEIDNSMSELEVTLNSLDEKEDINNIDLLTNNLE